MKYIVLHVSISSIEAELPFVFPDIMVHDMFCEEIQGFILREHGWTSKPVAAGFVSFFEGIPQCDGNSTSMGLPSRGLQDAQLIQLHDYTKGFVL